MPGRLLEKDSEIQSGFTLKMSPHVEINLSWVQMDTLDPSTAICLSNNMD